MSKHRLRSSLTARLSAPLLIASVAAACGGPMHMRPMPPTVARDPQLEAEAMRKAHYAKSGLGMEFIKETDDVFAAHVVSEFRPVQNELGIPVKRLVAITVEVRKPDGSCEWDNIVFSQKHMGGGTYAGLTAEELNDRAGMPCPGTSPAAAPSEPAVAASAPPAVATATGGNAPAAVGLEPAQIDEAVASMGPKAHPQCKAYVREVCRRQKGPHSLAACQRYATSMQAVASSPQGPSACKSMLDALPPASG
jgi:hypothetical protein